MPRTKTYKNKARIQVVCEEIDKAILTAHAKDMGYSLSDWMLEAAKTKYTRDWNNAVNSPTP